MKINKIWICLFFVFAGLLASFDATAQSNRSKQKNNFSKSGKSYASIRHAIAVNVAYDCYNVVFAGIGYSTGQYFGIGNRFMQQSVVYQAGIGFDGTLIHNVIGSFHCSFIGTADLNPFIYGISLQFATAKDKYAGNGTNNLKEKYMGNFYIRPEIGFSFPARYEKRTKEKVPLIFSIMYGFNIKTFMRREEIATYKDTYRELNNKELKNRDLPWTTRFHHMVTLRFNFNFIHIREFQ